MALTQKQINELVAEYKKYYDGDEDSRIIKLDPEDVEYHIEEARKVRELAKIMASKD